MTKTEIEKMKKNYKQQLTQTLKDLLGQVDDIVDRGMEKPTTCVTVSIDIKSIPVTYRIEYECISKDILFNGCEDKNEQTASED